MCVGLCARDIVQQELAGYFWVILSPLAKDPTDTNTREFGILSLILGPISNSYIAKLRSVHMWGQMLPIIMCIKMEEYMW